MSAQFSSILDLYTIDKDVRCNIWASSKSIPEITKWQQFLTHYVKVITASAPEDIPKECYPQFIDWVELLTTHRFHRLWNQQKRFGEALKVYHTLYNNLPDKLVLCSYRLMLFQSILPQFLADLNAMGLPIITTISPYYKYIYDEAQTFNNQILYMITRNNKYSAKVSKLLFHPCLNVHAILSSSPLKSASPVVLVVGPQLIKKLLSPTLYSIFSKDHSIDSNKYDLKHARNLLKQALTRSMALQLDDHETFFCLTKTLDTAKHILPIEYLMIKIGFTPETRRAIYTYKQPIEVDGKMLVNAPDTVFFSLTEMLIRDAHTHPAIFCWIARVIDLALDAPPTLIAATEEIRVSNLRTIPMAYHFFTHQNRNTLKLNSICFVAKKRHGLSSHDICTEFKLRDSSKLFCNQSIYGLYLTNSLPYATITKYSSAFTKAYLYLRLIDGCALDDISFNDIDDIYATIDNPEEFYSRIATEQYTPEKFINLLKQKSPQVEFTKINRLFISIELQLVRGISQAQGLSKEHFVKDTLSVEQATNMSKEYIILEDPISRARIRTPVRGCTCKHSACFDLETFVAYACETDKWNCPICAETIGLSTMYIDAYQYSILNYLKISGCLDRKILIDSVTQMPVFPKTKVEESESSILSDWADK
ncbi:Zinc finger domain protein [Giardia lamblia P15]|uniref:Zinc finger domain protein n=1 Tax=Giardia intestinalis (strain P15) TaxID=658858 RepID=E1F8F0_GIAIA|nr:Zinc finger domain protein [Giardia lamblia P15]